MLTPDVVAAVGRLHLEALPVLSVVTAGLLVEPLALQLPTCFEMRTLSGGLVSSTPE